MYVLVHNNFVVLGPVNWSRYRFENALMEELDVEELDSSFPDSAPSEVITYNTNVKIYPVREGQHEPHNPRIEVRNGPFWTFTDKEAIYTYRPVRMELLAAKNLLLVELATERWKKENKGTNITINGAEHTFSTDRETRNVLQQHITAGTENVNWKVGNGVWITLQQPELQAVFIGVQSYVQTCFDWEKQTAEAINAVTTLEGLLDIVIVSEGE